MHANVSERCVCLFVCFSGGTPPSPEAGGILVAAPGATHGFLKGYHKAGATGQHADLRHVRTPHPVEHPRGLRRGPKRCN